MHREALSHGLSLSAGAQSLGARQEQQALMPLLEIYERAVLNFIIVHRSIFRTESLTVYSEGRLGTKPILSASVMCELCEEKHLPTLLWLTFPGDRLCMFL